MPKRLPGTVAAEGFYYLLRHLRGETLNGIALSTHHSPTTIGRQVHLAAHKLVDDAQEQIMSELFPLALDLYKAKLKLMHKQIEEGKDVPIGDIESILNGMYVLNSPQLKQTQLAKRLREAGDDPEDQNSLQALLITRKNLPKVIDVRKVDDGDQN